MDLGLTSESHEQNNSPAARVRVMVSRYVWPVLGDFVRQAVGAQNRYSAGANQQTNETSSRVRVLISRITVRRMSILPVSCRIPAWVTPIPSLVPFPHFGVRIGIPPISRSDHTGCDNRSDFNGALFYSFCASHPFLSSPSISAFDPKVDFTAWFRPWARLSKLVDG